MRFFQEKMLSAEYAAKLERIIDSANLVEKTATGLQTSVERNCSTLRKQAETIKNRVNELKGIHEEVMSRVST